MRTFFKMGIWYNQTFLSKLTRLSEAKMLDYILVYLTNKDSMEFHITKKSRDAMASLCDISGTTVNRNLNTLKRLGLIKSMEKGRYKLNEDFFGYGRE